MVGAHTDTSVRSDGTACGGSVAPIRNWRAESNDAFGYRLVEFRRPAKRVDHDRPLQGTLAVRTNMLPTTATATLDDMRAPWLLTIVGSFENLDDGAAEHRPPFFGDLHSDEFPGQSAGNQHHPAVVGPADPIAPDR
jgi:hypothetical protein